MLEFDEGGIYRLVLNVGHRVVPEGKKRYRWKVWLRTDVPNVVERVIFDVQDGLSRSGVSFTAPPYECERTTSCVYEQIDVLVSVHYQPWLNRSPSMHKHEVVFHVNGRGSRRGVPVDGSVRARGVPLDGNERSLDEIVLLKQPAPQASSSSAPAEELLWHEYEARPGQFIAKPSLHDPPRARSGSWSHSAAAVHGSSSAPHPANFGHYPPLTQPAGGGALGRFALGRSPSFSSALLAAASTPPLKPPPTPQPPTPDTAWPPGTANSGGSLTPPSRVLSANGLPMTPPSRLPTPPPPQLTPQLPPSLEPSRVSSRQPSRVSSDLQLHSDPPFAVNACVLASPAPTNTSGVSAALDGSVVGALDPEERQVERQEGSTMRRRQEEDAEAKVHWLRAVADGDVSQVLLWLEFLGLSEHKDSFQQQAVDGKMLRTLSEHDLEHSLQISSALHRRRLTQEIDEIEAAALHPVPEPLPRRVTSEPARGYHLVEVTAALELQQLHERVRTSCRDGCNLSVQRVEKVENAYLDYKLEKTARMLLSPRENRAVPPQGGYFHGTDRDATLSICEHGFDDQKWKGGKFGIGQYLSADASRAAHARYTGSDHMLLLVEAVLGRVWHLHSGEAMYGLTVEKVRSAQYDSLAVPETDEIVVYLRFQAVPRYIIHFRPSAVPRAPSAPPTWRAVRFGSDCYEQRLLDATVPQFGVGECTRAMCKEVASGRDVFLKLVRDPSAAQREADALRAVGKQFAPELLATFVMEGEGTVLVLEAAHTGASLVAPCRRHSREGGTADEPWQTQVCYGGGSSDQASLLLLAHAQSVLQCVARVHEASWVHCDIKPEHFMRFPPHGAIKLVDFGSAWQCGQYVMPGHTKRYCAPELARAMLARSSVHQFRVHSSLDIWSAGLVLYELFTGRPRHKESVSYADIACSITPSLPRDIAANAAELTDAHARLVASVLVPEPGHRPSAADVLAKHVFRRADDTAERARVEIVAFFANPTNDLKLMREIQDLFAVFPARRRPEVMPAARLSDVERVLSSDRSPQLIYFSGHQRCGHLLFEPDEFFDDEMPPPPAVTASAAASGSSAPAAPAAASPAGAPLAAAATSAAATSAAAAAAAAVAPAVPSALSLGGRPARVPSVDALIKLVNPCMAPELKGLVLNACSTVEMARRIHQSLPHLSIVCWEGKVLDGAAKVFAGGLFKAIADGAEGATSVATAFDAGRAAFLRAGYREGNPDLYLHPPGHGHLSLGKNLYPWKSCPGCNPPVHGEPRLVSKAPGAARPPLPTVPSRERRL